jgi:hypothetical protein
MGKLHRGLARFTSTNKKKKEKKWIGKRILGSVGEMIPASLISGFGKQKVGVPPY